MARTKQQAKKNAISPKGPGSAKKSQFNIKQKSQSPFSAQSQAKKMKVKTTQNKSLRKNVPMEVLQEKSKVAALEKQIKSMQEKIRLIEKNQRQIQEGGQTGTLRRPVTRKMARELPGTVLSETREAAGGAKPKKKPALLGEGSSSTAKLGGRKRKSDEPEDVESNTSALQFSFSNSHLQVEELPKLPTFSVVMEERET